MNTGGKFFTVANDVLIQRIPVEYAELVENSNDLIQVVDMNGFLIYANRMWQQTLGFNKDELSGLNLFNLLYESCHGACEDRIRRLLAGEKISQFEIAYKTRNGGKVITEGSLSLYVENDEIKGIQGFFRDITQRKETEAALRSTEARFQTIFESSVAGIAMLAPDGQFLQANPAFCNFLGYSEDELLQLKITDVTHPDDIEDTLRRRNIASANRSRSIICEKRYLRKDGSTIWTQLSSTWFFDADGNPIYTVPVIQDITRRKEAEDQIRELAYYDSLTKLSNRRLFQDRLDQALAQAKRHNGRFALMFLDLDRFKGVNDTLGHAIGDTMLCQTAARLKECLRENDTVGRLGGDEFVILLSDYREEDNLPKIAMKMLKTLAEPYDLGIREVFGTTSIGIALYPVDGESPTDLLRCADMAMYAAKSTGGNAFRFYSEEMNKHAVARMDMEVNLRRALDNGEFFVEYQPQVDLMTNKVAGVEALLRWQHPQLGIIPPAQFIPLAEETNLILPLGEWVMQEVFEQGMHWEQEGYLPFRIAINVSGRQFAQSDFVETVKRLLKKTGVNPTLLEFEMTESVVMNDVSATVVTLNDLRALGINIAIDDFGTGYSSLSCLKYLPVNRLKIDKSFVAELQTNAEDRAIVEATIAMAKKLHLEVIAEGVETEGQYGFVQKRECDEVQGFYFSRPIAAQTVADKWLIKREGEFFADKIAVENC